MSQPNPPNPSRISQSPAQAGRPNQPLIFLETLGVAAASLIVLIPFFHLPIIDPDEGIIACGAERILNGQVPYRDFFSELGPASFYLHALIFKVGGINVIALRLTAWLLGGVISGLIYLLTRRILNAPWAVVAASIFPLICYPMAYRVSHHWWANTFLLLTTLALSVGIPIAEAGNFRRGIRWTILAGALAATTLLAMQSKGFWAIVMGQTFLVFEPWFAAQDDRARLLKAGLRNAGIFSIGTAGTLGVVAGYFAMHGAWGAWIDANLTFLFTNYRTYLDVPQASAIETVAHVGRLALTQPSVHFYLYLAGYVFFFFVAPLVAFGGSAARLFRARQNLSATDATVLLFLLQGVGGFLSEWHSPDVVHLMWAAPLILVLFVYEWSRLDSGVRALRQPLRIAGSLALALMVFTAVRKAVNMSEINGQVETRRGIIFVEPSLVSETQAMMEAIESRVPSGGETFLYPYRADVYFLTATRNPTRFDVLLPEFHRLAQIEEAISGLERARPKYIFSFEPIQLWTIRPHFPDDPPDATRPHPVGRALGGPSSAYRLETHVAEMEIWAAQP